MFRLSFAGRPIPSRAPPVSHHVLCSGHAAYVPCRLCGCQLLELNGCELKSAGADAVLFGVPKASKLRQ